MPEDSPKRIIPIETIDNIKKILGDQVVGNMISDPDNWDHSIFFSDNRYMEIEDVVQDLHRDSFKIFNQYNKKQITGEELDRKNRQLEEDRKELENNPNYEYWHAANILVGLHIDLTLSSHKTRIES